MKRLAERNKRAKEVTREGCPGTGNSKVPSHVRFAKDRVGLTAQETY